MDDSLVIGLFFFFADFKVLLEFRAKMGLSKRVKNLDTEECLLPDVVDRYCLAMLTKDQSDYDLGLSRPMRVGCLDHGA